MKYTFSINNGLNSVKLFIVYKLRKDLSILIFTLKLSFCAYTRHKSRNM